MNILAALIAPLALILPAGFVQLAEVEGDVRGPDAGVANATPGSAPAPLGFVAPGAARLLEQVQRVPVQNQVRIEERVIIRISPRPAARAQMLAPAPTRDEPSRMVEQEFDGCVPIGAIGGIQAGQDNRLLFFMRDRQVLSAVLERACSSRDFYSSVYIARSKDGMLCARRDKLQSRAGANCEVARFSRLVAVRD